MLARIIFKMNKRLKVSFLAALSVVLMTGMVACGDKTDSDSNSTVNAKSAMPAAEVVVIKDAYIRAMPPGQKVTAMFVTLDNTSDHAHDLVKVESNVSDAVELHEHKHVNGMMKMGQVSSIAIPKKGSVALQPGGYHVMLIGLKQDLKLGDKVPMKLTFEDGSSQDIQPEVKTISTD